ncbi:MAG: hypothetical protein KBA31_00135 [Alphaproteobacteria bacterium]|nr:hypothetical protein [Alphaproteobacteria bacterium]
MVDRNERTILGKSELAATLGWGRERLDRRIHSDPDFPVLKRASQGAKWQFDLAVVRDYLAENDDQHAAAPAELTPRARRETAMAIALEDKNRIARGELVERQALRTALSTSFAMLGKNLDGVCETIGRRLSLTDDEVEVIRSLIGECRTSSVGELREYFSPEAPLAKDSA